LALSRAFVFFYVELVSAGALARAAPDIRLNEHIEEDGLIVFYHACKLGLEGSVSKKGLALSPH
jgi:ATP-dependent DNA ligase